MEAASIICPPMLIAPLPVAFATSNASTTFLAHSISLSVGEKTSLTVPIWAG
jgi:hypothetical protein